MRHPGDLQEPFVLLLSSSCFLAPRPPFTIHKDRGDIAGEDAAGERDDAAANGSALGEEAAPGVLAASDFPRPALNPLPPSGPFACCVRWVAALARKPGEASSMADAGDIPGENRGRRPGEAAAPAPGALAGGLAAVGLVLLLPNDKAAMPSSAAEPPAPPSCGDVMGPRLGEAPLLDRRA
jgi:hypothetical protein